MKTYSDLIRKLEKRFTNKLLRQYDKDYWNITMAYEKGLISLEDYEIKLYEIDERIKESVSDKPYN